MDVLSSFYNILDEEDVLFLKQKPIYKRDKWGPGVKKINDKIKRNFSFSLSPSSKGDFYGRQVTRILANRELRIFIEILSMVGEKPGSICERFEGRFRLNNPIFPEDIEEYLFWFFDVPSMDDIDWQRYTNKLIDRGRGRDSVFSAEGEDKTFALRHNRNEVFCRLGLQGDLAYSDMVNVIHNACYDRIVSEMESGSNFDELAKKVNLFLRLGNEREKIKKPSDSETHTLKGREYYIETDSIEALPALNADFSLDHNGNNKNI